MFARGKKSTSALSENIGGQISRQQTLIHAIGPCDHLITGR
jgi:hypothetical protein